MNITEAQEVAILLQTLNGGAVDEDRVAQAAAFCKERVHKALFASPEAYGDNVRTSVRKIRSNP